MKIAISGKGGVGKTFIAGSLASYFSRHGHSVLAIDTDPSPNLAMTLGLTHEEASRIVPIAENEQLIKLKTGTEFSGVFRITFSVDDIIEKYSIRTPAGPSLIVMGTVHAMGAGCTCPANSLVKTLLRHLVVERNEIVILDMEAGIEHLGRGTAEHVDILFVITDANRKSLEIAGTICKIARNSAIKKVCIIGNRIADARQEAAVWEYAEKNGIEVLALIPFDKIVADAGMTGEPIGYDNSAALQAIGNLAKTIVSMNHG